MKKMHFLVNMMDLKMALKMKDFKCRKVVGKYKAKYAFRRPVQVESVLGPQGAALSPGAAAQDLPFTSRLIPHWICLSITALREPKSVSMFFPRHSFHYPR